MVLRSRSLHVAAGVVLFVIGASACGPFFAPDVFVRANRPDLPAKYVAGQLGILQTSFLRADLMVAYRYLNGGTLNVAEQKGWAPTYGPLEPEWDSQMDVPAPAPKGLAAWIKARDEYPTSPASEIKQERAEQHTMPGGYEYKTYFSNCGDDAFSTAAATLANRVARWGKASAALHDWVQAQDLVFENCSGGTYTPEAVPAGSPALLVSDRAYQKAAANFYGMSLDAAHAGFVAISEDRTSPWQPVAGYLVARTLVRQAFFAKQDITVGDNYDSTLMQEAARQLRDYLAGSPPASYRRAAEQLLALIRIRMEPAERMRELGALVSGPGHDANYAQDLQDILWRMDVDTPDGLRAELQTWAEIQDADHPGKMRPETQADVDAQLSGVYLKTATERSYSPIVDWTLTMQSLSPEAAAHAMAGWRQTHTLSWLVAALAKAPDGSAQNGSSINAAIDAAAAVPTDSPAWETVTFHRVRLLLDSGRADEARAVLNHVMPRIVVAEEPSSVNAFRGLAMRAAPTLDEFLKFAPRKVLLRTSEESSSVDECAEVMKDPRRHYNCVKEVDPLQMDGDAAGILNRQAPLTVWIAAAKSPALSLQLRNAMAMGGWTRAVLLRDEVAAEEFRKLLPDALRDQTGDGVGFPQWMVLARNPGLNPYLNAGMQRSYSYDFVESYRDNWCYKPNGAGADTRAAFLSAGERAMGVTQAGALAGMNEATLGHKIVAYVTTHPEEPRAAEALFLVLRMIRYGCMSPAVPPGPAGAQNMQTPGRVFSPDEQMLLKDKQDAARLLRRRYADSEWTKKAAPFAG